MGPLRGVVTGHCRVRLGYRRRKEGRFKARKNFLLDVENFDRLQAKIRRHYTQDNVALIKTELSKIRLAVSCPVEVYLMQAWLFLVTGNAYTNWPANTLEESLPRELARQELTWLRLREGEYSLPYDFAQFDHQPTTTEVVAFQTATNRCAQRFIHDHQREDFDQLTHCVLSGFQCATLTSPPGLGPQQKFKVTGGLMSGLRYTSCVGSGWNAIFGELARKMIADIRGSTDPP